jgi:hypothetical protein
LYSSDGYYASLVYFSIGTIPSGATVLSAYLYMYCNLEIGSDLLRIGILGDSPSANPSAPSWSETSVTYNNMPYAITPPAFKYFSIVANEWNNFDVIQFVETWCQGTYPNRGFQLFTTTNEAGAQFYRREMGTSWAPYLIVSWRLLQ